MNSGGNQCWLLEWQICIRPAIWYIMKLRAMGRGHYSMLMSASEKWWLVYDLMNDVVRMMWGQGHDHFVWCDEWCGQNDVVRMMWWLVWGHRTWWLFMCHTYTSQVRERGGGWRLLDEWVRDEVEWEMTSISHHVRVEAVQTVSFSSILMWGPSPVLVATSV